MHKIILKILLILSDVPLRSLRLALLGRQTHAPLLPIRNRKSQIQNPPFVSFVFFVVRFFLRVFKQAVEALGA